MVGVCVRACVRVCVRASVCVLHTDVYVLSPCNEKQERCELNYIVVVQNCAIWVRQYIRYGSRGTWMRVANYSRVELASVYCILLTGPRDRRGRCEAVTYFTLVFRRRPTLVESEFLLAVFECECSRAWAFARKLSRARPSTRECEASYSTLASRFRVSCNVRHRTVRVFELLACFMR